MAQIARPQADLRSGSVPARRGVTVFLIAVMLAGSVAATAQANYIGSVKDPAGDVTDGNPARDIVGMGMSYDRRTGDVFGVVELRADPQDETRSLLTLFAGIRTPTGCDGYPAVGFASDTDAFIADWLRLDRPTGPAALKGTALKRGTGTRTQRFETSEKQLGGRPLNCIIATLSEPGNPSNTYDTTGPVALTPQPALALRMGAVPKVMLPNRPRRIRLTVSNPGDAATGPVRIRFARARGLRTSPASFSLKSIPARGRRTATVRVRLTSGAKPTTAFKVTVKAGRLTVRDDEDLYLRRPRKKPSGGGGGGDRTPRLCNRYQADLSGQTGGSLVLVPC